jgi:UDP:flavonoid glycosyltransferase YjiC (YdhE family)
MTRYLFYTAPGSGHVYPLVPTMQELQQRGHQILARSEQSTVATLDGLGFSAAPIHPAIEDRADDTWRARTPIGAMRRSVRMYVDRARYEVDDLQQAITEHRPDVIVVDNNCWGAAAAAQASGLPWAQAATFLLPLVTPDAPPFGLGLRPASGVLGRARDAVLRHSAMPIFDMLLPPVNRMRAGLGLPAVRHVPDLYMQAPLVLSYTAEPLEYPRTHLPASVRMVGPGVWDPNPVTPAAGKVAGAATAAGAGKPAWLAELRRPVILVTISTVFQDDAKLINTALEALAGEPYDVVVTTASFDPESFARPANATLHRFVPHSLVLERAAAVVCHGGMGITQKALLAGVPACIVPFGRDQLEVARRVIESGAGTRLPAGRLTPVRLRDAVRAAIPLKPQAEAVAARLRSAGGAPTAATALEDLVRAAHV